MARSRARSRQQESRQRLCDVDQLPGNGVRAALWAFYRRRRNVDREDDLCADIEPESRVPNELPAILEPGGRSDHWNAVCPVFALQQCGPGLHPADDFG